MFERFSNRFKFFIERLLLRGAHYQLLIIAIIIICISIAAGMIAYILTAEFGLFRDAAWWAFLRLTDPGYLGDDKGLTLKIVSTIVTISGYVFFMGALIAIMTQWLNATMRRLESGLTPITREDHILILGYTNRTPTIVKELIVSEGRLKRFLKRIGAKQLHIVILTEEVTTDLANLLREELGTYWNSKQITFRSGTPMAIDHLQRTDFIHASVIISPGSDFSNENTDIIDTRMIKSLLTMSNYTDLEIDPSLPLVVAEIFDARKIPIAVSAYAGEIEVVASDVMISRLIAQNVRHRGLSYMYAELLSHNEGNEIYIREFPELNGKRFHSITRAFQKAIPLGILRKENAKLIPILNPPENFEILPNDRIVFMARRYMDIEAGPNFSPELIRRNDLPPIIETASPHKKLLILGWNHKIPVLLQEFLSYENESFEIDLLSLIPISEREQYLKRFNRNLEKVKLTLLEGDYISITDLQRVGPAGYDNIILLSNSWMTSHEESDARTILGYLLLREMLPENATKPEILIELLDSENEKLFRQRTGEVLISPVILSHILAHVALRRELNIVFEELFTVGGAEIYFKPASAFDLDQRPLRFSEIGLIVATYGEIALGIKIEAKSKDRTGGIFLNPPPDSLWELNATDRLVVLTTYT